LIIIHVYGSISQHLLHIAAPIPAAGRTAVGTSHYLETSCPIGADSQAPAH
jgi:hypothetical protein